MRWWQALLCLAGFVVMCAVVPVLIFLEWLFKDDKGVPDVWTSTEGADDGQVRAKRTAQKEMAAALLASARGRLADDSDVGRRS